MSHFFFDALATRAQAVRSQLCVGLDPRVDSASKLVPTCLRLAEATAPFAAAFKVNAAFFERFGGQGVTALERVVEALPEGPGIVLDAKRGDIGATMQAYADSLDHVPRVGAITLSPYLGLETFEPFWARIGLGIFVLGRTSNPGASELQAQTLTTGESVSSHVARTVAAHRQRARLGLVAGATDPLAIAELRARAPETWLLLPGVGEQGARAEDVIAIARRPSDGLGALVNVSRSLASAADPAAAARDLAASTWPGDPAPAPGSRASFVDHLAQQQTHRLARLLLRTGAVRFGSFTLKSGASSPFYLDLRRLAGDPEALGWVGQALADLLRPLCFDRLAALPYAALPLGAAASLASQKPLIYPRNEAKKHGTGVLVEGPYEPGETAVVLDDLVSSGSSKFEALEKLRGAGLVVRDCVVVLDRGGPPARAALAAQGLTLHALATAAEVFQTLRGTSDGPPSADIDRALAYLETSTRA